jgi:hypothetical protein
MHPEGPRSEIVSETAPRPGRGVLATLGAVLCAVALGCRGSPPPSAPAEREPTPDEKVLLALDCYNPMYQVDEEGHVIRLNLVWRHLPAPALAEIGKLRELQAIDLAHTTVTDDGLAQLKDLHKLRNIGLAGTLITDEGLVHLQKLPDLKWIWLPKDNVSEAAVEKLKEARPDMTVYLQ